MRLDTLVERIESAFGDNPPFTSAGLADSDRDVLLRVFGDEGYQVYLQDQVNRQIIRDYLTNAVMLGFIPEDELPGFDPMIASKDARASLSLHMLMSSVEQAPDLLSRGVPGKLEQLKPGKDSPPDIRLIRG
ncbi:hypothetical protein DWB85_01140 [Seongchinamella sediminis]|uniref:Uncharacterized protein n=1 Tax=Seongchinamella sediminis TaxID=2283635 RepID=A0A3L7E1K4_9GAMM|nr:hypothetical protein [Seongchinamella sediminis]RLQ23787.1 hypothetical protein DWB85_01140 [Seongchinamella sediminis]